MHRAYSFPAKGTRGALAQDLGDTSTRCVKMILTRISE
jgi:hypothetical protein